MAPGNFSGGFADPQATWDGQSSAMGGASLQHYSPPAAPAYPNGAAASFGEAAAGSGYGIQGYAGAAAGAAQVEYSAGSYASSTGLGYGSDCAGLAAAAATVAAPQPAADEEEYGDQEVQRSQGSLLNWARPAHRAAQRSFTGPPGRKPGAAAPPPAAAAPAGLAAAVSAGSADGQQPARRGISSFLRSVKSTPASLTRPLGQASPPVASPTVAATAAPAAAHLPPPAAAPGLGPAAAAGANNADLFSSVRNWQRQKGGQDGSDSSDAAGEPLASAMPFSEQQQTAATAGRDGGLEVTARSDSLLQWRLPSRAPSSRQAAAGCMQQQPGQAGAPPAPAVTAPPRLGSASFKRTLSSFKSKLFGGEATPAEQHRQQLQQQPGSPGWSIAAVRVQEDPALPHQQQRAAQECGPARGRLTLLVPEPAGMAGGELQDQQEREQQEQQPGSPSKSPDRLSRLRQMTERRRVMSAPAVRKQEPQQPGGFVAGSSSADQNGGAAPSGPRPSPFESATAGTAAADGPEGSPGPRAGLRALKARARTARIPSASGGSGSGGGSSSSSSSLDSMEAVDDVFGPDQPPLGSVAAAWSPLRTAGSSVGSLKVRQAGRQKGGGCRGLWVVQLCLSLSSSSP